MVKRGLLYEVRPMRSLRTIAALLVCVASLSFAAVALASTDFYVTGAPVNKGETLIDIYYHYITKSYAHNLSGGNSCAGAWEYAGLECTGTESSHPYEGTHYLRADMENPSGYADFNAHADY
jgi:hypothetical protein